MDSVVTSKGMETSRSGKGTKSTLVRMPGTCLERTAFVRRNAGPQSMEEVAARWSDLGDAVVHEERISLEPGLDGVKPCQTRFS